MQERHRLIRLTKAEAKTIIARLQNWIEDDITPSCVIRQRDAKYPFYNTDVVVTLDGEHVKIMGLPPVKEMIR